MTKTGLLRIVMLVSFKGIMKVILVVGKEADNHRN